MAKDETVDDTSSHTGAAPLRLEEFLPYRLAVVTTLVSQALSRIHTERHRIGVPEWRVLAALGQHGVMTGKALSAHGHMHKTKVSRAVAVLETRKLVARRTNREDQRESLLSLTAGGRAIYEELAPAAIAFAEHLIEGVDSDDRAAFDRTLDRLAARTAELLNYPGRRRA